MVQPPSGAVRAANRAGLVDVLRRTGQATRAELIERTGLSRATVSSLVGELLARGLVSERRTGTGEGLGRPPTVVALNRSAGLAIAVDVGVRHVAVAVGDLSHSVLTERWATLGHGHRSAEGIAIVLESIDDALRETHAEPEQVVGAAISIAAPVAPDSDRLLVPGVLPGWNGAELADQVRRRWRIPVALDNDANLGALGEAVSRGRSGDETLIYLKVASRVGLGICLGTQLYHGHAGYAGELGHVTVDPDGEQCWCGRCGCLELSAGGDGMLRRLRSVPRGPRSIEALVAQAHRGVPEVRAVVDAGVRTLARGLANASLVLAPAEIVVGGELAALGELITGPIAAELATIPFGPPVDVSVSHLGERASLLGAMALVLAESAHFVDHSVAGAPACVRPSVIRPGRSVATRFAHPA